MVTYYRVAFEVGTTARRANRTLAAAIRDMRAYQRRARAEGDTQSISIMAYDDGVERSLNDREAALVYAEVLA